MTARRLAALLALALAAAAADVRQLHIDSFEQVWTTIRDRHPDPRLGGLDWEQVRRELRPRIERAETTAEARAAIEEMLARLGHSHLGIIPGDIYGGGRSAEGTTGMEVRVAGGAPLVVRLRKGSPAEEAGVRPGWEILRIDGRGLAPALADIPARIRGRTWEGAWLAALVMRRLAGPPGSTAAVEFRAAGDRAVTLALRRARPPGRVFQFGYLPPAYVWSETRRLPGEVGYFAFNAFLDPENIMRATGDAVTGCRDCRGFVIDLRGNGGGLGGMAMGLAGWFAGRPGRLGTLFTRDGKLHFLVTPRPEVYEGPLAILVDGATASAAEIFAGGMQALGRARVFGSATAGSALPAQVEMLPNGDAFLFAFADYVSEDGRRLEGAGVRPDVEVSLSRERLLEGRDAALDAALQWIKGQGKEARQ